jgi:hypothetical protein
MSSKEDKLTKADDIGEKDSSNTWKYHPTIVWSKRDHSMALWDKWASCEDDNKVQKP